MLTPMDIHNRDFKRATIRGYKEDEVDEFLDRVVADYDKILRENEKLKEQANSNEKEIAQFRKLEKNMQDTLMVAQRTAEEVISSANKNAEEMKKNTQLECQNIREQAQIEARRQIDEATSKLHSVREEYDRLVRDKNAFLLKIRTALETELAVITQLLNSIPNSNENKPVSQPQVVSNSMLSETQTTSTHSTSQSVPTSQPNPAPQPGSTPPQPAPKNQLTSTDSQATITVQKVQ